MAAIRAGVFRRDRSSGLLSAILHRRSARTLRDLAPEALAKLLPDALLARHPLEEVIPGAARHGLSHLLPAVRLRGRGRGAPLRRDRWRLSSRRQRSRSTWLVACLCRRRLG